MGAVKHAMMEREDDLAAAARYLVSVGILDECEAHGEMYEGNGDLESLWPVAMIERNKKDRGKVPWAAEMKAREFTDLLKEAFEQNCGDGCGYCAKNERD